MRFIKLVGKILFVVFAIIGLIFTGVFIAMRLGLTNVRGTIAERNNSFFNDISNVSDANLTKTTYAWANSAEWGVLESVFIRDQDIIKNAAKDAGISPRILLGGVIGEHYVYVPGVRSIYDVAVVIGTLQCVAAA